MFLKFSYRVSYSVVAVGNMARIQDLTEITNIKKIIDEAGKKVDGGNTLHDCDTQAVQSSQK